MRHNRCRESCGRDRERCCISGNSAEALEGAHEESQGMHKTSLGTIEHACHHADEIPRVGDKLPSTSHPTNTNTRTHTRHAHENTRSLSQTQRHTETGSLRAAHTPKLVAHVLAAAIGDSTAQTRLVAELARLVKNLLHQLSRRRQNEATRPRRAPVALRNRSRPGQRVAAGARSTKRLQNAALIDALETNARHPMQRKQRPTYAVTCHACTVPGQGARGT